MIEDIYKKIDTLKKDNSSINIERLKESLIEGFKNEFLDSSDKVLLDLVFMENPTQEDLDNCLKNYDIEVVGGHKALMLAYFMKMHPELTFPKYVEPRLKGLIQYYRFNNLKLISAFTTICHEFNKHGINDIMVIKGGAMKHLRPEFPRVMGDIDILVKEKDYEKSINIVKDMGYDITEYQHSADVHPKGTEEGLLDIHKYIEMETGFEKSVCKDIFNRATKQKVFSLDIYIPCVEDLVFISLINLTKNLINQTSSAGNLYSMFDCSFLINSKQDFDWNIVLDNVEKSKSKYQLYLAICFINSIVPNFLPEKLTKKNILRKELENYCALLFYKRFYLGEMKEHSHALKVGDVIKNPKLFKEYMSFKPKYFICKRSIIKNNPYLVKKILKIENKLVCE